MERFEEIKERVDAFQKSGNGILGVIRMTDIYLEDVPFLLNTLEAYKKVADIAGKRRVHQHKSAVFNHEIIIHVDDDHEPGAPCEMCDALDKAKSALEGGSHD